MSATWLTAILSVVFAVVVQAQTAPFSSSDAADAAERLSGRRAHMSADIRRLAGGRLEGPAVTMRLIRDEKASLSAEGLKAIKVVEEAPAGTVIVVCGDGNKDYAVFGPTFATLAHARQLGGFVVDGAMRGVTDLKQIGVPVFARGTVSGSAGGHYRLEAVNDTVSCGEVRIAPGDLIVGDEDGVAIISRDIRARAVEKARALRDEKDAMLPLIARHKSYIKAAAEYQRQRAPLNDP